MPEYDVSLYANKKQKTTPESAKEALEALLPVLSDEHWTSMTVTPSSTPARPRPRSWARRMAGCSTAGHRPLRQATHPRRGTDLACMMGRETTLERVKAAIEKLNG